MDYEQAFDRLAQALGYTQTARQSIAALARRSEDGRLSEASDEVVRARASLERAVELLEAAERDAPGTPSG